MPWKEETMFDNKLKFALLYESEKFSMSYLCREFGISRTTGHKVWNLYLAEGEEALKGRSCKNCKPRSLSNKINRQSICHLKSTNYSIC
jgi:hypothetical protein